MRFQKRHCQEILALPGLLRSLYVYKSPTIISRPALEVPHSYEDKLNCIGNVCRKWTWVRRYRMSKASVEFNVENDVVRFFFDKEPLDKRRDQNTLDKNLLDNKPLDKKPLNTEVSCVQVKKKKKVKMSRRDKVKQLKWFRLKARKQLRSPNPEVVIRYKIEKAKRKEAWLIEKLRKLEVPKSPAKAHDPEMLTKEEKHYFKRTGEKKKHYVMVGRRGTFGGVVVNMHQHWLRHETVRVICRNCKPEQVRGYAEELERLSKGIVIDIKGNCHIIIYRGKNYVQPEVMLPPDTLSKRKAMEKFKFMQSLDHTSSCIEILEKELEDYKKHFAKYKQKERIKSCLG